MDAGRANKLADRIAQIVAEMLERRVKDPRLGFVTVTDAKITGDLREATVYYTVYGSADEREGTAAALRSATGLIRSEAGRQTGLRHTPSRSFVQDTLPEGPRHIDALVPRAGAAGKAQGRLREGGQAGDRGRRARHRGQGGRDVLARRGGQAAAPRRDPAGRPRRHPRPDGDGRAGRRGREGHPAAGPPGARRKGGPSHPQAPAGGRHPRRPGRGPLLPPP